MTIEPKVTKSYVSRNKFLFYDFENVDYKFTYRNYSEMKTIKNLLHRFKFVDKIKSNISSWSYWTIRDKDTPEIIAYKLYKTSHLYWIVLIINEMHDPNWSWPLTDKELYEFVQKKYGDANVNSLHHYESGISADILALPQGIIVPASYTYSRDEISNLQYERNINESKRKIKLLKPENLESVLSDFRDILTSGFSA